MDTEREGLPSGSEYARIKHCPGSRNAIAALPEEYRNPQSDAGTEGTRRHEAIEMYDGTDVDAEYVVKRAFDLLQQAREETIIPLLEDGDEIEVIKEKRYWLLDDNLEKCMSGKMDEINIITGKNIILNADYKTMNKDHGAAWDSEQFKAYAVILYDALGAHPIYNALIQPSLSADKQLTITKYTEELLIKARAEIIADVEASKDPDAPLSGGSHCDWCPARLVCKSSAAKPTAIVKNPGLYMTGSLDQDLWKDIQTAKKIIKDAEDQFKKDALEMIQKDPKSVPGFREKLGNNRKTFNAEAIGIRLREKVGMSTIFKFCKFSVNKDAIKAYKESRGLKTLKEAEEEIFGIIGDDMSTKRDKSSIEMI